MKKLTRLTRCLLVFTSCVSLPEVSLRAAALFDPARVAGSEAIDPPGEQTVEQNATGSVSQTTLEALPGFEAIQNFPGWSTQGTPNYIVFTSDSSRPDVRSTYGGLTGSSAGGANGSAQLRTSSGTSIGLDSGSTTVGTLALDFGSATYSGTTVTAFASTASAPTAAGFTVSGLGRVTSNVTIQYFGTDDTTVLSTQVLTTGTTDINALDGTVSGPDGYTGFRATGTGAASGIGKIVLTANSLLSGNAGIGIDDLGYNTGAAVYHMTVSGSGVMNGSSWANALPVSMLSSVLQSTLNAGDTLLIGSGTYARQRIILNSSGEEGRPKYVTGVSTGGGLPVFTGEWVWTGSDPYNDSGVSAIGIPDGASHWTVSNIRIRNYHYGVYAMDYPTQRTGLNFKGLDIQHVRYGFYLSACDDSSIEDTTVQGYGKSGFRLENGCDIFTFRNCLADHSPGGALDWFKYREGHPYGFFLEGTTTSKNKNIDFIDCVAKNNRRNLQAINYWNGDGFVANASNETLSFLRCIAIENEDGGFDVKPGATYRNCVSIRNYRGFKVWYGRQEITNCVSIFPFRRSNTNLNGGEGGDFLNIADPTGDAEVILTYFTGHGTVTRGLNEDAAGSISGTHCILSMVGSTGTHAHGTFSLVNSGTYRSTQVSGTNPNFVNPSPSWNGVGNAMDSQTYGLSRGYNSTRP